MTHQRFTVRMGCSGGGGGLHVAKRWQSTVLLSPHISCNIICLFLFSCLLPEVSLSAELQQVLTSEYNINYICSPGASPLPPPALIHLWQMFCVNGRPPHKERCCLWGFPEVTVVVCGWLIFPLATRNSELVVNLSWTHTMALLLICLGGVTGFTLRCLR